jgi:hypothetical protein
MRVWLFALGSLVAAVLIFVWTSDKVTLQGERTIYTIDCRDGAWQGVHCTGRLARADRFRFRALKAQREVVFWTAGAVQPSSKFTECDIQDGRNWKCKPNADTPLTITHQMSGGMAVHDPTAPTKPFHAIAKWRWFFVGWGVPIGRDADD